MAILEFFLHHPGQALSRDQILEHVWNNEFEGGDNLVEVYVGRLRRKLHAAGAGTPLATQRGVGYRLEVES